MNTVLPSSVLAAGAAGFLARFEGLRDRLPGDAAVREAAADAFRTAGLPSVRQEAWRYTNLRPMAEQGFHGPLTPAIGGTDLLARLPAIAAPRIVLVDGRFRADLSVMPTGMMTESFAAEPAFGGLARPERESLAALNTMLAQDGAVITVPTGHDGGTLLLVSLASGTAARPVAFHPRHVLRLEAGARLTVIEVAAGEGVYLHNPVSEITVGKDAHLAHIRLQDESHDAFHLATIYADVAGGGTYDGFSLILGARLGRTEIHARLTGTGAAAHLNAAQLLGGTQHADFTTIVSHDAPGCASRQTVKSVLTDHARGVFQGRIEVARIAQKTDGYQMNQALLLSPDAEIDCKPELEIFADDVKCSHGATVGELDPEQLFYLRSRGIALADARAILVRAFLAEALDPITHEPARAALEHAVENWWTRQVA